MLLFAFSKNSMEPHILLISCSDGPGLVHRVTGIVFRHQLNIISNCEFVDRKCNHFFMRTEFSGQFDEAAMMNELKDTLPADAVTLLSPRIKKDIVVLATKEHHCLSDLLIRHEFNELGANIVAVISNHETLHGLVDKFKVPFFYITHENKTREQHEQQVMKCIHQFKPSYLVLAKYMRVLSPEFVSEFPNRIINIHHSFLPAFVGANPYAQAHDRGVKIIGATAHFVNHGLDDGPIIAQSVIPVTHTHCATEMARAGRDVEKIVLARSLKLVLENRVFVYNNKTVIFD
jgi:formyltetrahydrofolate deformylase